VKIFFRILQLALLSSPLLFFGEKIDAVYTWVDGNDPEWQKKKEYWLNLFNSKKNLPKKSISSWRWNNHDELKYSLRSLYKHAPFINHIYIVTMGQRPSWLKPHSNITIVDHKDIFLYPEHLPTFNSQAIESHLHRIPGLCEKYLYLNDDFFFNQNVCPEDFFLKNGLVMEVFENKKLRLDRYPCRNPLTNQIFKGQIFLNKLFGEKTRNYPSHAPHPFKKSFVYRVEQNHPKLFYAASAEKFRDKEIPLTYGFLQHYGQEIGLYVQSDKKCFGVEISNSIDFNGYRLEALERKKGAFFYINDESTLFPLINEQLTIYLDRLFPQPAPWEFDYP
jgi:hypothetical protein